MRGVALSVTGLVALVAACVVNADGAMLAEDYAAFEAKREALEKETRSHRRQHNVTVKRQKELRTRFRECTSITWSVYWERRFQRAEEQRSKLEVQRQSAEVLRKNAERERERLESRRREIERRYRGKPREIAYETDIRAVMEDFETFYFQSLTKVVFPAYQAYREGVAGYATFVEESVTICNREDFTAAAVDATDSAIDEMTKAITRLFKLVGLDTD
jgi:hypothetical protein